MSISNWLTVDRWAAQIHGPAEHRSMEGGTVFARGDTIYSYGTHFAMAEIMRDRDGSATFVLVNGDRYSHTTDRHQSNVRGAIHSTPSLIVPFSALAEAGIDRSTVRPLEIASDTWTARTEVVPRSALTTQEYMYDNAAKQGTYVPCEPRYLDGRHGEWQHPQEVAPGMGQYEITRYRHWLGEAVFEAKLTESRTRKPNKQEWELIRAWQAWRRKLSEALDVQERTRVAGSILVSVMMDAEPKLPDQLIGGRPQRGNRPWSRPGDERRTWEIAFRRTRKARFLSAFDHNESRELYFLAELPASSRAETVEQAFDDLAPPIVKQAQTEDIEVRRQGDVFAIPCELPREITDPAPAKRERLLGTDHTASEVLTPQTGETYARGVMRHEPNLTQSWREPDHARIKLDGWHLIVRNTVPNQ